ncbi:hypothetical protein GCM10010123_44260 [Pilimelia anulata]|uniref:Uncharacterized protein n=1 Tax=Pilimelia anulata TaxID=53371 RepID=A0A8J3FD51_9ACTN|nr:hypothetical protein [Pilimelia anulata]GGK09528.1 hypothetical protein GCM10010123_44260 [Pilimelia anulata]
MMRGKILGYALLAALLFLAFKDPTGAGGTVRDIADAVGEFLSALTR